MQNWRPAETPDAANINCNSFQELSPTETADPNLVVSVRTQELKHDNEAVEEFIPDVAKQSTLDPLAAPFIPGLQAGIPYNLQSEREYIESYEYTPETDFEVLFQYDPELAIRLEETDLDYTTKESINKVNLTENNKYDVQLAQLIVDSQKYNFEGMKIPLRTRWNTDVFSQLMGEDGDQQVIQFIKYGWPIDRERNLTIPDAKGRNHSGANQFPHAVDKHIQEEIDFDAVVGGFAGKPMEQFATSPINTRPKRSSDNRRIILDLSWGKDEPSINEGLSKYQYLGKAVRLKYPTVFTLVERIKKIGNSCLMYKKDLH